MKSAGVRTSHVEDGTGFLLLRPFATTQASRPDLFPVSPDKTIDDLAKI
jgi:hypothetical protein